MDAMKTLYKALDSMDNDIL